MGTMKTVQLKGGNGMANKTGRAWFLPGHKYVGPVSGREQRARLLEIVSDSVSNDELRSIIAKNKRDALGVMIVLTPDGRQVLQADPQSTGFTRAAARKQLLAYLLGRPPQPIEISEEESADSILAKYTSEQIDAIIAAVTIGRTTEESARRSALNGGDHSAAESS
jgi:hypothetical protein